MYGVSAWGDQLDSARGNGSSATIAGAGDATLSAPASLVLRICHLSKTFPGTRALLDVDLDVRAGEVHALVGQNGSGKSTLIKILAGYHDPDPGSDAMVTGERYELGDSHAAHAAGLRFVHQDLGLVPMLNAVDNLALGIGYVTGRGGRIRWRQQTALARQAIASIGYQVDVRRPIGLLEPIEKTAVAIARALRGIRENTVSLLVLDEPTAAMPQPEVERLFDIIRRVKSRGVGVLYVSHHLAEVFAIADRVTVLRDGRNVGTRVTADLKPRELVEMMTGGVVDDAPATTSGAAAEEIMRVSSLRGRKLHDFSVGLHRGEVVGVAGITGSGREEVCPLIFGGMPRGGDVVVGGRTLEAMCPDRAVDLGVGLVPADRHRDGLVLSFSVGENLTLTDLGAFWRRFRLQHGEERRQVAAAIERFGVKTPAGGTMTESLSGGNQQKIVLGKWLRLKPRVLLLDEPTQGVDIAAKADVHRLIDEAAREGTAVLVCSTDESELERLCDRVVVLRGGRLAAEFCRPHITAKRLAQESLGLEHAGRNGESGAA
jgi:ribose transport system ATP-binding protein